MKNIWSFFMGTLVLVTKGSKAYYIWVGSLLAIVSVGMFGYLYQVG